MTQPHILNLFGLKPINLVLLLLLSIITVQVRSTPDDKDCFAHIESESFYKGESNWHNCKNTIGHPDNYFIGPIQPIYLVEYGLNENRLSNSPNFSLFPMSGDCAATDWNDPANKMLLTVSATASTSGNINVLLDDNLGNNSFFYPDVSIANLEVLRVTFPEAEILTGLEYVIGDSYMFNTNATIKIQGSNDGSIWDDMTPNSVGTSPSLVISGNEYTKDRSFGNNHAGVISSEDHTERMFWTNSAAYIHYRILGVSGNTNQNPWVNELFFETAEGFDVSNFGCTDNGTAQIYSDDLLTFDFTPIRGSGTYTVAIDGGFTISPTMGTFGQATSFTISSGSSGAGDLNLTLTDSSVPCTTTIVIPNSVNGCLPGPCGEPDWNSAALKSTIAGDFHIPGTGATDGPLTVLVDSDVNTSVGSKNNSFTNEAVFSCEFPQATVLTGMEVVVNSSGTEPITAGVFRVEASSDGINYTAISGDFTHGSNLNVGAPQYGTGTQAYTFPFVGNTTAYQYYRIYAVSMSTRFGRSFNELYFDYTFFDPQLSNQSCFDNGTFENYSDDQVTFDLNPTPGMVGNTYNVEISGGFTITPTSGTYGQVTSFAVSSGSSGAGDLTLTLVDLGVPCAQVFTIPNSENSCIPGPCGGPDWNMAAIKSTITGAFHIPGTGGTDGPLTNLVDSDVNTSVGTKVNSFTNEAVFICEFPEQTVLTGMEVVVNASGTEPITAGTFIVEGSNDGTNYTPLSGNFVHGTNLNLGAAQYGSGAPQAYTFPIAANTDAYSYYRIYATTMNTRFGRSFNELYFNYTVYDAGLDNVHFGDNGTPTLFDDDLVNFSLNPQPGSGSYNVQVDGAYTVTPSTGTYGQVTNFQISEGSAGTGDITVIVSDQSVPCAQEIIIPNPDLTATVESSQAACASPTDNPLGTITLTATDGIYAKAEFNIGTAYAGQGYASATDVANSSSGFEIVSNLPNPQFITYYTVRAYATETLYRDFVVFLEPKSCSVADLSVSVSPATDSANEGEELTYIVTLTNAGPDPAINVEVKVDIPAGLELLSASPSVGEYSPGTQLWDADLIPVGSHELTITYKMK